eukprot:superscaffoldBa00011155_g25078
MSSVVVVADVGSVSVGGGVPWTDGSVLVVVMLTSLIGGTPLVHPLRQLRRHSSSSASTGSVKSSSAKLSREDSQTGFREQNQGDGWPLEMSRPGEFR